MSYAVRKALVELLILVVDSEWKKPLRINLFFRFQDLFSSYEVEDPWVQSFIVDLDAFLQHFKPALTPTNYDKFMSQVTNEITCQMERAVMKITFNRVGPSLVTHKNH